MAQQRHVERNDKIRSVERAIDVLQALNRRPLSTLQDLHGDTGLPKPSIVRLLRTLEAKGLAAQSSSYGAYHLRSGVKSLASGFHHEPQIVEVAEPVMADFTRLEGWPLSLALFDGDAMVVRACTIRLTALSLEHSALDRRLSLLRHAIGRAYLAFASPHEQSSLLAIHHNARGFEVGADDRSSVAAMIERVRHRGYALRDPRADPRSATIGVPILENGRVVASLGLTWIAAAMTVNSAVERYFPMLQGIARRISGEMAEPCPAHNHGPSVAPSSVRHRLATGDFQICALQDREWNRCD